MPLILSRMPTDIGRRLIHIAILLPHLECSATVTTVGVQLVSKSMNTGVGTSSRRWANLWIKSSDLSFFVAHLTFLSSHSHNCRPGESERRPVADPGFWNWGFEQTDNLRILIYIYIISRMKTHDIRKKLTNIKRMKESKKSQRNSLNKRSHV